MKRTLGSLYRNKAFWYKLFQLLDKKESIKSKKNRENIVGLKKEHTFVVKLNHPLIVD